MKQKFIEKPKPSTSDQYFLGVHLAGLNSAKTCLVALSRCRQNNCINISEVYEKIGNIGSYFCDDRIFDIIKEYPPLSLCMVDTPVLLPPCLECRLDVCPGISSCEVEEVALMRRLTDSSSVRKSINPQAHRLWEHYNLSNFSEAELKNIGSNSVISAYRTKSLQKRLNSIDVKLVETSVAHVLSEFNKVESFHDMPLLKYKSFKDGLVIREEFFDRLITSKFLAKPGSDKEWYVLNKCSGRIEVFHAFIASFVGYLNSLKLPLSRPAFLKDSVSWPVIPKLANFTKIN